MRKFSIYSGVWILTILLLVASVTGTKKYNIISTINNFSHHCHHNHCYHRHHGQRKNFDYLFVSFTHVLQDIVNISPNDVCLYDSSPIKESNRLQNFHKTKLKDVPVYFESVPVSNSFVNVINYSVIDTRDETSSILAFNDTSSDFIKESKTSQRGHVDYLWKRRTLCAVSDDEQHTAEVSFQNDVSGDLKKESAEKMKTLLDYDGSVFMNDIEDPDSLKTHIRVKRSKSELNPDSFANQQDYLKDLANSFPRNSYESIDENSYDDDVSFDTKREIKSQEFFANDEESIGLNNLELEDVNDRSKMFDINPVIVSSPSSIGSSENDVTNKRESFSSEKVIDAPSNTIEANSFADKKLKGENQEVVSLEEPCKEYVSIVNQRSQDLNSEISNLPEDSILAVELVRKKRNNYAKVKKKRNLREKVSLPHPLNDQTIDSFSSHIEEKNLADTHDEIEKPLNEEKRLIFDPEKSVKDSNIESENRREPSKSVIADLKADLLRFRRNTKNNRRKYLKSKKKRKRVKKIRKDSKGNNSPRWWKNVFPRNKKRSKSFHEKNHTKVKKFASGKSNTEFASVVSKKNPNDSFHHRVAKSSNSIENTDFKNDPSSIRDASSLHARLKKVDENKIDTGNSEPLVAAQKEIDASDVKVGSKESLEIRTKDEGGPLMENEKSIIPTVDVSKLRTKRDKNTDGHHGFLTEEEELKFYQNIREPKQGTVPCAVQDKSSHSVANEAGESRAVRSIEEVKKLVKKLVTKVGTIDVYS